MSSRSLLIAALSLGFCASMPAVVCAQDAVPQVQNAKFKLVGAVNANAVYVRSGPNENYYPTAKLDKGTQVVVVGESFGWLKIIPPAGSFSYVAKTRVMREGESSVGIVNADALNVWAGSSIVSIKSQPQCKLNTGDKVTIIGEQDEYYKIAPPADAYLYIAGKFVEPVRPAEPADLAVPKPADNGGSAMVTVASDHETASTTQPAPAPDASAKAEKAIAEFDRLEAQYKTTESMDLDQQPLAEMLAGYQPLTHDPALPAKFQRMAEFRVAVLSAKIKSQNELLASRKQQAATAEELAKLEAQRQELQQRLSAVKFYTAVGTLQTSTLTSGGKTLYRLTDPANGRTLCYIQSDEPKLIELVGQFVGTSGELSSDPQLSLKLIATNELTIVDPARIGNGVGAKLIPPSIIGTADATAKTE